MQENERDHDYRTIWISDLHLGTRGCKAEFLLDFLGATRCERLYLVGDVIDGWRLRKSPYWNQSQGRVVQAIMRKARHGTEVVYVPGNHDEALRGYVGLMFGGVAVEREVVHSTADGKRLLVCHGDQFDGVVQYHKWLARLGDRAYNFCLHLNHWFNVARRRLGLPYWSLSAYLKHRVKNAVDFICQFEQSLADEAKRRGLDGVVAGHIHHAEMREIDGILYCNDGDWVESCTALVEHHDGRLEILDWPQLRGQDLLGLGERQGPEVQADLPFEEPATESR
jgi:UDP-2,3-diacylglucosamine pyrophosphatase LpxH